MSERMRFAESLSDVQESAWENLVVGHPALRLAVLKGIGPSASRRLKLQAFLVEDEGGLAAAAVCNSITAPDAFNWLDFLLFGRTMKTVRMLGVSTRPVLLFAPPFGSEGSVVVRDTGPKERHRLLGRLLDGIGEYAEGRGFGVAFLGVSEDEMMAEALRGRGFLETEDHPMARLDVEWGDFDGYVEYLRRARGSTMVRNVRNERKRNRESGVDIRLVPRDSVDLETFYMLVREHYRRKNQEEPLYGPQFLAHLIRTLGEDFLVFEARRGDRCLAMAGIVRSGTVGWVTFFGIDRQDGRKDFTYPNLCYYTLAEHAMSLGLKTVLYGYGAYEAKYLRGCRLAERRLFYRPRRRLLRTASALFFRIHGAWYRRKRQ